MDHARNLVMTVWNAKSKLKEIKSRGTKAVPDLLINAAEKDTSRFAKFTLYFNDAILSHPDVSKNVREVLRKHNACVDDRREDGATALHLAIKRGKVHIVKVLLANGASVDVARADADGSLPLHMAAERNEPTMLELLYKKGANTNAKRMDGSTALHIATKQKSLLSISWLLDHGARTDISRNDGLTPFDVAQEGGTFEVIIRLLENGNALYPKKDDGSTYLHETIERGDFELSSVLLKKKSTNINVQRSDGSTCLHIAVTKRDALAVNFLLNNGARIHLKDKNGLTAFHIAMHNNFHTILTLLLAHGFSNIKCLSETNLCQLFHSFKRKFSISTPFLCSSAKILLFAFYLIETGAADLCVFEREPAAVELFQSNNLSSLMVACDEEIDRLKKTKYFDNVCIPFYDILTQVSKVARYARNEEIWRVLSSHDFRTKFPLYAGIMNNQLEKGRWRIELVVKAAESLSLLSNHYRGLPTELQEEILLYLSDNDLENLVASQFDDCSSRILLDCGADVDVKKHLKLRKIRSSSGKHTHAVCGFLATPFLT